MPTPHAHHKPRHMLRLAMLPWWWSVAKRWWQEIGRGPCTLALVALHCRCVVLVCAVCGAAAAGCLRGCLRACVLFTRQLDTLCAVQPLVHTYTCTSINHCRTHQATQTRMYVFQKQNTSHGKATARHFEPPKATRAPLRPADSHARATLSQWRATHTSHKANLALGLLDADASGLTHSVPVFVHERWSPSAGSLSGGNDGSAQHSRLSRSKHQFVYLLSHYRIREYRFRELGPGHQARFHVLLQLANLTASWLSTSMNLLGPLVILSLLCSCKPFEDRGHQVVSTTLQVGQQFGSST